MIAHELVGCNNQFWLQGGGCQCNHTVSCSMDARGNSAITVEPQSLVPSDTHTRQQDLFIEDCSVLSMNDLLMEYSKHLNSETRIVSSGGIQQLLNKKSVTTGAQDNIQPRKGSGSDTTTFHDLPDSLQLHIFSFLNARELCQVTQVCSHWFMLSSDDLLWHNLLERDVSAWKRIGHTTLPSMYKECQSDWSNKQIYLKCSPEIHNLMRQDVPYFHNISTILRSFLPRKTPKFAMFGPGLESSTSGIARKILEDRTGLFTVKGMFPGMSEGVGSGFTIRLTNNTTFHLCMLYTTTRQERENMAAADRVHANRMLVHEADKEEEKSLTHFEVRPAVRQLCRSLDGFVFVVDASKDSQTVRSSVPELRAMLNEMWASPNVPLLVLAARRDETVVPRSAVDIAHDLGLGKLSRPWQVECCIVDNMEGVTDALQWGVAAAQRQ